MNETTLVPSVARFVSDVEFEELVEAVGRFDGIDIEDLHLLCEAVGFACRRAFADVFPWQLTREWSRLVDLSAQEVAWELRLRDVTHLAPEHRRLFLDKTLQAAIWHLATRHRWDSQDAREWFYEAGR